MLPASRPRHLGDVERTHSPRQEGRKEIKVLRTVGAWDGTGPGGSGQVVGPAGRGAGRQQRRRSCGSRREAGPSRAISPGMTTRRLLRARGDRTPAASRTAVELNTGSNRPQLPCYPASRRRSQAPNLQRVLNVVSLTAKQAVCEGAPQLVPQKLSTLTTRRLKGVTSKRSCDPFLSSLT